MRRCATPSKACFAHSASERPLSFSLYVEPATSLTHLEDCIELKVGVSAPFSQLACGAHTGT